jgi:hypothetical protein
VRSRTPVQSRLRNHGGLTPPAPALLCECPPAKNDFCDAQTHVHNSGGRQPAVGVVGRTLSVMWWKRTCNRVCETTGGLRPPLLVVLHRGCVSENCGLCDAQPHAQPRAAGVSPPWFGNTVRTGADFFGLNMFLQRTFGLTHHGWLTPAARDARRSFAVKSDICGARTHVFKSGGRQPAVVWESRLQKLSIHVWQTTRLTTPGSVFRVVQRGLLPTFGSQLRWVCLFVQRSRIICYRCSVRSCVSAGGSRKPSLLAQT